MMSCSYSNPELQVQDLLLNEIRREIDHLLKKEISLDQSILYQMELATARNSKGNKFGTILCMNKIVRIRLEREQVSRTIAFLEAHVKSMEK
jgi:predicted nucleotidyltransferase